MTRFPTGLLGPKKSRVIKSVAVICSLSIFSGLLVVGFSSGNLKESGLPSLLPISPGSHSSQVFDTEFFRQAESLSGKYKKEPSGKISGGIIPHHLLAAPLIAGFFAGLKSENPDTVILIGPNHHDIGKGNILSSQYHWQTLFGDLLPDKVRIDRLTTSKRVLIDEDVFETEHAIYPITAFIKKTWPKTKIIPLIIKSGTTREECDALIAGLRSVWSDKSMIIASVDFSHYLSSDQADKFDLESIKAILDFDAEKVFSMDSTRNFDSPQSIYITVKLMKTLGIHQGNLIANANSAKISGNLSLSQTTSYVTMYFPSLLSLNIISRERVFEYQDHTAGDNPSAETEIRLIATGDVIPARSVNSQMMTRNDFRYPFLNTVNLLNSADIVFINLESPLITNCPVTSEGMVFCGSERVTEGLKFANVKVANLANNHLANYGKEGIENTVRLLTENNIQVTGLDAGVIISVKGKRIGFLGYNDIGNFTGIAGAEPEKIAGDVTDLKKSVDYLVVAFHWGVEYTSIPTPRQRELAHKAIDSGADLIIGNHPHWVQGVEVYKNKFITYAHGNFIFDQMWSRETTEGVVGVYTIDDRGLKDVGFYPVVIENYSQPRFADQAEALIILERMRNESIFEQYGR